MTGQLQQLRQRLLPHLLCSYGATLSPADQACLRLMRCLDSAAATVPLQLGAGSGAAAGNGSHELRSAFTPLAGMLWGGVLSRALADPDCTQEALQGMLSNPAHVDPRCSVTTLVRAATIAVKLCDAMLVHACTPSVRLKACLALSYLLHTASAHGSKAAMSLVHAYEESVCRRMALTALLWPEARSLDLAEDQPHLMGSKPHPLACTPYCRAGYDPAWVVPAARSLAQAGLLTPAAAAHGGWVALLLRCLATQDDALRYGRQDARLLCYLSCGLLKACPCMAHGLCAG